MNMNKSQTTYITPEIKVIDIECNSVFLQGSDSPSFGYGDNDLGGLN